MQPVKMKTIQSNLEILGVTLVLGVILGGGLMMLKAIGEFLQ